MNKHTPGPWTIADGYSNSGEADAIGVVSKWPSEWVIADVWKDSENLVVEAEANARLIAAAPDLLAALEEAKDVLASVDAMSFVSESGRQIGEVILDALIKARGQ